MDLSRATQWARPFVVIGLCALGALCLDHPCFGYSVIIHEAIIDAEWDTRILPYLLERYPNATPEELRLAKSYAYGGSVIQDMGYYPLTNAFFSHLTHYVRSGEFVQALFAESRNINDLAFALGALSHYSADIQGHSKGINRAVPLLYRRLGKKYGSVMTWEDSPWAHMLTEFSFDTLEVVAGHVAPQKYHDWIGFRIADGSLRRAFRKTYGLELDGELRFPPLSYALYREVASRSIPEMTKVAWAYKGNELEERATALHHRSLFHLRRPDIEAAWQKKRTRPGPGDHVLAFVFRLLPKVGPLDVLQFHTPTDEVEQLFADSLKATSADYDRRIRDVAFNLPNLNLDTGRAIRPGEYRYGDMTYAQLLHQLAISNFRTLTPALRDNLVSFFSQPQENSLQSKRRRWRSIEREVKELKAAPVFAEVN